MSISKAIWKKVLVTAIWLMVGAGTIVLLVAATQQQSGKVCKEVIVRMKGADGSNYVSEKEILHTISGGRPDLLKGALIRTFDLRQLEELLEQNLWIRNAELFFDNNEVLHVDVTERIPVARVFSESGETFYIDEMGNELPANNSQVARVPVFTSFPAITKPLIPKDSMLLQQVKDVGAYIVNNDFWMAQIDQINIVNYEMELVPKLGKHQILFGEGKMVEQKFNRLLLFYQKIMQKTGWNYYSTLDLRFQKQVVAVRRDSASLFESFVIPKDSLQINTVIDSTLLDKDPIVTKQEKREVINPAQLMKTDTVKIIPKPVSSVDKPVLKKEVKQKVITNEEDAILNEIKKQPAKKTEKKKDPKAVMPSSSN